MLEHDRTGRLRDGFSGSGRDGGGRYAPRWIRKMNTRERRVKMMEVSMVAAVSSVGAR